MKLYSVSQSIPPYRKDIVVGHNMSYDDAYRMSKLIKFGVVSVFPSSDLPATAKLGDDVRDVGVAE